MAPASRHAPAAHYMAFTPPAPHHRTSIRTNAQTGVPEAGERLPKKTPRQNRNASATNHAPSTRLGPQHPWHHSVQSLFPKACAGRSAAVTGAAYSASGRWWSRLGGQAHSQLATPPPSPVSVIATRPPMIGRGACESSFPVHGEPLRLFTVQVCRQRHGCGGASMYGSSTHDIRKSPLPTCSLVPAWLSSSLCAPAILILGS